jgi:hypothetical protein
MTTPPPPAQAITAGTLAQAIADVCAERDRLRKENAILQEANRGLAEQGDRLRTDCAAMQSALEIATDAGKGYVPADKARVIAEALRDLRAWTKDDRLASGSLVAQVEKALAIARAIGSLEAE